MDRGALEPGARRDKPTLVTRWDLDKTYLRSEFHTTRDLLRSALERPDQKRAVPGAARLLRELARPNVRVHILSGSPEQMKRPLVERLTMDGVRFDELTLKPNLQNLLRFRFGALKDQLGYKLPALLEARMHERHRLHIEDCPEVLVGDDSEADAFVYSLYADVCTGLVQGDQLEAILEAGAVHADAAERAIEAERAIRRSRDDENGARFRILIHLDQQTPPSRFGQHGGRLVPFYNYAQAALVLLEDGHLPALAAYRVALELCEQFRFDLDALARSYVDLHRRGHLQGVALEKLTHAQSHAPSEVVPWPDRIREELTQLGASPVAGPRPAVDYLLLAQHHRGGRNRRR
jgi:hypothetical protein